jgi:hypothetical protein
MKTNFRKTLILFKLSALSLFFQACGKNTSSRNYPTAVGKATSIDFSSKENGDMVKSDIEILGKRFGVIVQKYIQTINNKETTPFSKQTKHCDISDSTEQKHTKSISFDLCQDDEIIQNGDIKISYYNTNQDGRFPELINIVVQKPYFFNDLNLTRDTEIEVFNIVYKNEEVISFSTFVTGQVIIDKQRVFNLQNFEQRVKL